MGAANSTISSQNPLASAGRSNSALPGAFPIEETDEAEIEEDAAPEIEDEAQIEPETDQQAPAAPELVEQAQVADHGGAQEGEDVFTAFDHRTSAGRLEYVQAARRWQGMKSKAHKFKDTIPLAVVRDGILPKRRNHPGITCPYRFYISWLRDSDIDYENPLWKRVQDLASYTCTRKAMKYDSTTYFKNIASVLFLFEGIISHEDAMSLLPGNFQASPDNIDFNKLAQDVAKAQSEIISRSKSLACGILIHMMDQTTFTEDMPPFETSHQRRSFYLQALAREPMLLIAFLHQACSPLALHFIYGNGKNKVTAHGEDLDLLRVSM